MNTTYTFTFADNGQQGTLIFTSIREEIAVAIASAIGSVEGVTDVNLTKRVESVSQVEIPSE